MSSSIRNLHCRSWSRGHHACSRVFVQERQCYSFGKWWCQARFDDPVFICWRECRFILRPARRNPKSIPRGQYKLLGAAGADLSTPSISKNAIGFQTADGPSAKRCTGITCVVIRSCNSAHLTTIRTFGHTNWLRRISLYLD